MFCSKCGANVQSNFCPNCGSPVAQQPTQPTATQFNTQPPVQPVVMPVPPVVVPVPPVVIPTQPVVTPTQPGAQSLFDNLPPQIAEAVENAKANPVAMLLNAGATLLKVLTFILFFTETISITIKFYGRNTETCSFLELAEGRDEFLIFSIIFILVAFLGIIGSALGFFSKKVSLISGIASVATSAINLLAFFIPFIILCVDFNSSYTSAGLSFLGILVVLCILGSAALGIVSAIINKKNA